MQYRNEAKTKATRTYGLIALVIALKPLSNVVFTAGVKAFPHVLAGNPLLYIRALVDPLVTFGVVLQVFWLLARMALLSRADLSFVVPATSVGYALSAGLAQRFLGESVSLEHWAGIALICLGSAFVGSTSLRTTNPVEPATECESGNADALWEEEAPAGCR